MSIPCIAGTEDCEGTRAVEDGCGRSRGRLREETTARSLTPRNTAANPLALGTTQPSLFLIFSVYLAHIGDFETDATPSEHADFLPNPRSQLGVSPVPDDR